MIITTDLHLHSHYSKMDSVPLEFSVLAKNAAMKGITVLGTGDCFQSDWLNNIKKLEQIDEGTFRYGSTYFILTSEIETKDKVHHLLLFPNMQSIYAIKHKLKSSSSFSSGRPNINVSSKDLARLAKEEQVLMGPAHIFDPFKGLYAKYQTITECYEEYTPSISFVELGLGADTYLADTIKELHGFTYLTNSDTHNPHPIRLGREFTRFEVKDISFSDIQHAITRKRGNRSVLNAGIPSEEGKYYQTGCPRCHTNYTYKDASAMQWKCNCGSRIVKGIKDKIQEHAQYEKPQHPYHRPFYLPLYPLHEIITRTLDEKNPFVPTVQTQWERLISTFGSELYVLLETPIHNIAQVSLPSIAEAIQAFRLATITFQPGGAGLYGDISIPWEEPSLLYELHNG